MGLEGRRLLIRGVTLTLVGLAVQQSGLVLHRNLNHNDIYYLVQAWRSLLLLPWSEPAKGSTLQEPDRLRTGSLLRLPGSVLNLFQASVR